MSIWPLELPYQTIQFGDRLAGPRVTSFRWDVLGLDDSPAGTLDGAMGGTVGGRIDWSNAAEIRSSGSLSWMGRTVPDWLGMRIQPWEVLEFPDGSKVERPLGIFIPSTPDVDWDMAGAAAVDLYDKLIVLRDDAQAPAFTAPAGANPIQIVRELILGAGETRMAITDTTETLRSAMVWDPGTPRLKIINDLLTAANYWSLWVDVQGYYRAEPYVRPQDRAISRVFGEGPERIYIPKHRYSRDTFSIPNVVTLVSRGDGDTPALWSKAVNGNKADPLSVNVPDPALGVKGRGREVEVVEEDVEATSQAVLDEMAARRMVTLSRASSTVELQCAPVPLLLNDRVGFVNDTSGLNLSAVVQSMSIDCSPAALMSVRLVEVVPE